MRILTILVVGESEFGSLKRDASGEARHVELSTRRSTPITALRLVVVVQRTTALYSHGGGKSDACRHTCR